MEKTKEALTFLDPADEATFFARLAATIDDVQVIDGSRWASPTPPARGSIEECHEDIVLLWSPTVHPTLASRERGGAFDGPSSGVVIQWMRSRVVEDTLRSGRLAVGYEARDAAMARFVTTTFEVLRSVTTDRVVRLDGSPERTFRIGPTARSNVASGRYLLRHCSADVQYTVPR